MKKHLQGGVAAAVGPSRRAPGGVASAVTEEGSSFHMRGRHPCHRSAGHRQWHAVAAHRGRQLHDGAGAGHRGGMTAGGRLSQR
jgi:hypothetical protein